jgi:branched-chain amino acid transport system permease protein
MRSLSATENKIVIYGLILLAYLASFAMSDYHNFEFTIVWSYVILLIGYNLLTGYNGQFSLGQSAFYALGAYTTVIMIKSWNFPYYATILPAGILCFIFGLLLGFPALRLKGPFLALITFSLVVVTPQILKHFESITGGMQGLSIAKPQVPLGLPLSQDQWMYALSLTIMLILFILNRNFIHSNSGRAIIAIRDNPLAAAAMGINLTFYKTFIFGVSAFYAGISGALAAIAIQFVAPDMFTITLAIEFLIGIIIGGLSSIAGPIYGAFFIYFVPKITSDISPSMHVFIYGMLILLLMMHFHTGISGLLKLFCKKNNDQGSARF